MTSIRKFKKEIKKDTYTISPRFFLTWKGKCFKSVYWKTPTKWIYIFSTGNNKKYWLIKREIIIKMKPNQIKHIIEWHQNCKQPDDFCEPSFYEYMKSKFRKKWKKHQ